MSAGRTGRSIAGAAWLARGPITRVLGALDRDGEEARVVGGAVRNELMGVPVHEVDIATTALPQEVVRRVTAAGCKAVPTGIAHGTVTVVADGHPFEVTTLRRDVETFGRYATVAFGRDWEGDAHRRDFTFNALSATRDGVVFDYTGGLADIEARRVRFIGDAATRIAEDYLRILRFFRFHAAYGHGHPAPAGLTACILGRDGLDQLSRERVRMEMMKLMVAAHAGPTLAEMAQAGLLLRVIGLVPNVASFENAVKSEAAAGVAPDATRRLGALAVTVLEDADYLSQRLRLSNAERARLVSIAEGWRRISPAIGEQAARILVYRLGPEHFTDHAIVGWARSQASSHDEAWRSLATLPQRWTVPAFPIKSADLVARDVDKGPALGAALRAAEAAWIAAGFPAEPDAIAAIADAAAKSHAA